MKKLIAISILALACSACYDETHTINDWYWPQEIKSRDVLLAQGYHDIQALYLEGMQCSATEYDPNAMAFIAVDKDGHIARGQVCNQKIIVQSITKTETKEIIWINK